MGLKAYPVIDLAATGDNIRRLRVARGLTVRDLQSYFGLCRAAGDLQVAEGRDPGRRSTICTRSVRCWMCRWSKSSSPSPEIPISCVSSRPRPAAHTVF